MRLLEDARQLLTTAKNIETSAHAMPMYLPDR
jgi:hypothetical protein